MVAQKEKKKALFFLFVLPFMVTQALVFYRTRVYQMQPRNGQNWHSSVEKYVQHNRKTAKIRFCTSLKSISISGFVDTRDTVNAD